jgi:hypothetical protein
LRVIIMLKMSCDASGCFPRPMIVLWARKPTTVTAVKRAVHFVHNVVAEQIEPVDSEVACDLGPRKEDPVEGSLHEWRDDGLCNLHTEIEHDQSDSSGRAKVFNLLRTEISWLEIVFEVPEPGFELTFVLLSYQSNLDGVQYNPCTISVQIVQDHVED